jgi:iron complex outermembrane receptor protein
VLSYFLSMNGPSPFPRGRRGNQGLRLIQTLLLLVILALPYPDSDTRAQALTPVQRAQIDQRRFNIPAGPLAPTLNRFADETGVQLVYDAALAEGRNTAGVSGTYTPDQALQQILSGTGVTYRFTNAKTVTLERTLSQPGDQRLQLEPTMVEAPALEEETVGYRPVKSSFASKLGEPLLETPQAVDVITSEVIKDQAIESLPEALRNVPTAVDGNGRSGNFVSRTNFFIRGFRVTEAYRNGMNRIGGAPPPPMVTVESMEFLKGPSSLQYGQLSPGGILNIVTKKPKPEPYYLAEIETDSYGSIRGTVDLTGPIGASKKLQYRLIVSRAELEGFRRFQEGRETVVAPSLSLNLSNTMKLFAEFEYYEEKFVQDTGVPFLNGKPDRRIPYRRFLGEPDARVGSTNYDGGVRFEAKLWQALRFNASMHYNRYQPGGEILSARGYQPGNVLLNRIVDYYDYTGDTFNYEANLSYPFTLGMFDNTLLVGADYIDSTIDYLDARADLPPIDVFNPSYQPLPPRPAFDRGQDTSNNYGVYFVNSLWIADTIKLLGGVRYDQVDYQFRSPGFVYKEKTDNLTPQAGLVYKLFPATSLYGSYAESFQQPFAFDLERTFKPTVGKQFEAGAKQEFANGLAFATLSLFHLTEENRLVGDPDEPDRSIQVGEVETAGIEATVSGEVWPRLNVLGSYGHFFSSEITKDTDLILRGKRSTFTPDHTGSLWVTYDLLKDTRQLLRIGGGLFISSGYFQDGENTNRFSGPFTIDLGAWYDVTLAGFDVSTNLNLINLLDYEYYGLGRFGALPQTPRSLRFGLSVGF